MRQTIKDKTVKFGFMLLTELPTCQTSSVIDVSTRRLLMVVLITRYVALHLCDTSAGLLSVVYHFIAFQVHVVVSVQILVSITHNNRQYELAQPVHQGML